MAFVDTIVPKHALLQAPPASVAALAGAPVSLVIMPSGFDFPPRQTRFDCSPQAGTAADALRPTLYDETGHVTSCKSIEPNGDALLAAANPGGDERVLDVIWSATPCEASPNVLVGTLPNGYFVHGALPKAPCSQPPVTQALRIHLNAAITADEVTLQFDRDGPTTSGQPPVRVACAEAADVTIVDILGVVESCAAAQGQVSPEETIISSNPGGNTNVLQISWLGPDAPCNYEIHLTHPDEDYQLDIYEMDASCQPPDVVRTVNLQLTTPIDAAQIMGTSIGGPPRTGPRPSPSAIRASQSLQRASQSLQRASRPRRALPPALRHWNAQRQGSACRSRSQITPDSWDSARRCLTLSPRPSCRSPVLTARRSP